MVAREALEIRTMTPADLRLALEWAAAEGWNPGLRDVDAFFAADPRGFLMGFLQGEPIACISTVAYDDAHGFLGLYIVKPGFRGKGHGMQLWRAGMAYLGDRNVGLDGVVAQQANYRKSGFQFAYRHVRHEGVGAAMPQTPGIVELASLQFEKVQAYDRSLFPADRPEFLRRWIDQPGGAAFGYCVAGKLAGYGVLRPCRNGFKIGPLFADDPAIAAALFAALSSRAVGAPIFLDIPEVNKEAALLVERHGMKPVFECARMYTKEAPAVRLECIFGVTSLELG